MLGTYNNWNIIKFNNKNTPIEDFNDINKVIIDGVSENMTYMVHTCNCVAINTTYTIKMGYYFKIKKKL